MKYTKQQKYLKRQIDYLNRLAKKERLAFDAGDGIAIADEIRFLEKYEDMNEEDCFVVYFDGFANWYHLEECKFFILQKYKKLN